MDLGNGLATPRGMSAETWMEEALEPSPEISKLILSALDQVSMVSVTDGAGNFEYVNDHFCRTAGYSREELVGANERILNSGYHSSEFFEKLWATILAGRIWSGEFLNRARDGRLFWISSVIIPFRKEGPKYRRADHFISISTDVTGRKKDHSAGMATISHDLKNPLSVIVMNAKLIRKLAANDPIDAARAATIRTQSETVDEAAGRLGKLIDQLLR